ncbi:MAG: hypothetical protein HY324_02230 [Chlamydiia bacterium]|nr:hypothetical protein [Chlamydiia bacterium]
MSVNNSFFERGSGFLKTYAVSSAAGVVATVPVFYAFIIKSARQLGTPVPHLSLLQITKSSTVAGLIMGAQITLQAEIEPICKPYLTGRGVAISTLTSAMIVGAASAPILAMFNGKTMGYTMPEAIKKLTARQIGAITARETFFLSALALNDPFSKIMCAHFGDQLGVKLVSSLAISTLGSILGHIPDVALTRWQKGLQVECFSQLRRGLGARACAVSGFSTLYCFAKEKIDSFTTKSK